MNPGVQRPRGIVPREGTIEIVPRVARNGEYTMNDLINHRLQYGRYTFLFKS